MKKSLVFILLALALQACSSGGGGGGGGGSSDSNGGPPQAQDTLSDIQWQKIGDNKFPAAAAFDGTNFYYIDSKNTPRLWGGTGDTLDPKTSPVLRTLPTGSKDFKMKIIGPDLFLRYQENGVDKILQKTGDVFLPPKDLIDFNLDFTTQGTIDAMHYYNFNPGTLVGTWANNLLLLNGKSLNIDAAATGFQSFAPSLTQSNPIILGQKVLLLGYSKSGSSGTTYPALYEAKVGNLDFTFYPVRSNPNDAASEAGFVLKGITFGKGTYLAGIEAVDKSKIALLKSTDLRKWEKVKTITAQTAQTFELKGLEFQNNRFVYLVDQTLQQQQTSCWVRIYNQDFSLENEKHLIAQDQETGNYTPLNTKCLLSYTGTMRYADRSGSGLVHGVALEVTEPDTSLSLKLVQSH